MTAHPLARHAGCTAGLGVALRRRGAGRGERRVRRLVLSTVLLCLFGCAQLPWRTRPVRECPGQLVPTQEIAGNFLLRQRVRVEAGSRSFSLRLVTQKRGDEIVQVGIDPLGVVLFALRQNGSAVEVEALPSPRLQVEPINLLRDFHRIRFLAASKASTARRVREGTAIRDLWQQGSLRERRFERVAGDPSGIVSLRFETPAAGEEGLERIFIDNGWCGYRAEVVTLVEETAP